MTQLLTAYACRGPEFNTSTHTGWFPNTCTSSFMGIYCLASECTCTLSHTHLKIIKVNLKKYLIIYSIVCLGLGQTDLRSQVVSLTSKLLSELRAQSVERSE